MDSEKYVEERLIKIYKKAFVVAGIFMSIFLLLSFIIDEEGIIIFIPFSIFIIATIFGYSIWTHTKKSESKKVLGVIITIVLLLMMSHRYLQVLDKENSCDLNSGITVVEVQHYNAEYSVYDGRKNIKGKSIQQLIRDVQKHNKAYSDDSSLWINVHVDDKGSNNPLEDIKKSVIDDNGAEEFTVEEYNKKISEELSKVKESKTYAVACGYERVTGYVVDIEIVLNEK